MDEDDNYSDEDLGSNPSRPTSALDNISRQNLLNILLEGTRNTTRKSLLHRLIYIGRLSPEVRNPVELGDYYKNFFRSLANNADKTNWQSEPASGLLLLYPSYFVHILEGPENLLYDVIEDNIRKEGNAMLDCKVLVFVSNIPGKLFSTWQYQVLSLTAVRMDASKMQDTFENSVTDALTLIHKLANEFLKAKAQMKGALDLTGRYAHLLIPQDLIESLLGFRELLTFEEYKEKYMSPMQVALDSEFVWPIQQFPPQTHLVL